MRDQEHSNIAGALGVALVAALALASRPVFAHIVDGSATGGFLGGFAHPLFGLDHVVAMIAVGLWGVFLGPPAIWLLPITFPMIMAVGGANAIPGGPPPAGGSGVASSPRALRGAVAPAGRAPPAHPALAVGARV